MNRYKTIPLILLAILMLSGKTIKAQSNWEMGVRFGDDFALDLTIPLRTPRLHTAVYFTNNIAIGTYFDWMFALSDGPASLKFYPGVGPELYFNNSLDVAVAGDFGVEYSFGIPLTIGLDWRPRFMLTNSMDFYAGNWGVLARFRFGQGTKFVKAN